MLGTVVNTLAILAGGTVGLLINRGLNKSYQETIMQGMALVILVIGISNALETQNMILVIASVVIGSFLGSLLKIEAKLESLGQFLQSKVGGSTSNIAVAFVSTSLIFCVGAMAIVGALESGIHNQHDTLFAKSMLDGISSIIFASTLGVGVLFSALAVFIYQGSLTLLAGLLAHWFVPALITEMSAIGGILIIAIAINILEIKKIKVGNMLPAIFVPVLYFAVIALF